MIINEVINVENDTFEEQLKIHQKTRSSKGLEYAAAKYPLVKEHLASIANRTEEQKADFWKNYTDWCNRVG